MDQQEALKILGLSAGATPAEIKKARDKLAIKWHPDKNNSPEATKEFQKIQEAYETLTQKEGPGPKEDSSDIDEDAVWLMEQKIKNALDYNEVSMTEIEDEVIKDYQEKLRKCKTKADLEKFTSEVVTFIQIYARARNAGFFDKEGNPSDKWKQNSKPAPATETRSEDNSNPTSPQPKYAEFTCDYCSLKVGSDDPRPKYTFKGSDKAFCSEACREYWDKNDRWWKDWEEKQKKEAQEWEEYKRQQDQKWTDYFRNLDNNSYSSYSSTPAYTPTSGSSSSSNSISAWLNEYNKEREKHKNESLKENKKRYIREVLRIILLKSVPAQKLNERLGLEDWREKINQSLDVYEAMNWKFDLERMVEELAREYTCAKCGAVKNNYYPWEKKGKKYCSIECRDDKDKPVDQDKVEKLEEEVRQLRDDLRGVEESVHKALWLLLNWVKQEGVVNISLKGDNLVIRLERGNSKTLKEKDLTPAQKGLKKHMEKSGRKSLNRQELEKILQTAEKEEKSKRGKGLAKTIGGLCIVGVIVAFIIWVIVRISRKKD